MTSTPAPPPPAITSNIADSHPTSIDVIDIAHVAELIARDGVAAHHQTLRHIADLTDAASLLPGASGTLRDHEAPDAMRARAFLVVARHWDTISAAAAQKAAFDQSFAALASQWVAHQELRSHGAISQLARSRDRLDELRLQTHRSLATH